MSLVPLLIMWLWSQRGGAAPHAPTEPNWPTSASPPPVPPIPAFHSQPPPPSMSHPSADTGTPLAQLHSQPPVAPHADSGSPAAAAAKMLKSAAAHKLPKIPKISLSKGAATKNAAVQDLQTLLIKRGAKLTRDGLYGPKTASAWNALARSKGLAPAISRVGPKIARVVMHTWDVLAVPPIP